MSVLHNEAYGFQRLWELNKCSNYIEALIFNINAKFSTCNTPIAGIDPNIDSSSNTFDTKLRSAPSSDILLVRRLEPNEKIRLAKYYLQFAAVNSQLKNHRKAS